MTTKAERNHLDAVAALGCLVCRHEGNGYSPAIIHHVRSIGGNRITRNHSHVLPLCPRHHGVEGGWGIGFHAGSREWQRIHGTEAMLLDEVKALLEIGEEAV